MVFGEPIVLPDDLPGGRAGTARAIEIIEQRTGRPAQRRMRPLPPGDVGLTASDPTLLESLGGQRPATPLASGMARFIDWYRAHPDLTEGIWQARLSGARK